MLIKLNVFYINSSHDEEIQKQKKKKTQVESADFEKSERNEIYILISKALHQTQLFLLHTVFNFSS